MFYRIVEDYKGEEFDFYPVNIYESIVRGRRDIKEVCFAKTIAGCFFAISMFLKENRYYHIYITNQEPCARAYNLNYGDFAVTGEVRYRIPVKTKYIGKFFVDSDFSYHLTELYNYSNINGDFDKNAIKILNKYYDPLFKKNYNRA